MRNLHRKYWIFLLSLLPLGALAQNEGVETDLESDSTIHFGGGEEEEFSNDPLFSESSLDLGLWDVNDSLRNIPAYDTYCHWDTRNLFLHKTAQTNLIDTVSFTLCRETCDFEYPVQGALTSDFGPRHGRMHCGVDIDLETGDNVAAAFEGMVRISEYHSSYGNVVVIRHPNGLETLYAHLSQRKVKPGDYVEAGTLIGLGGNTGRSYGAHLHFEVRYLGEPLNPNKILDVTTMKLRDWEVDIVKKDFDHSKLVAKNTASSNKAKKFHTVKSGETLSSIARKRGTSIKAICKLNGISQKKVIRPGQKLRYK